MGTVQAPTLTGFLLARIAEDADAARQAHASLSDWDCWPAVGSDAIAVRRFEVGSFIAVNSPARVLAECEAKRAIVERAATLAEHDDMGSSTADDGNLILAALASIYAGHSDYRSEWAE